MSEILSSKSDILYQLQEAVRNSSARERFPIGTVIPDCWQDMGTTYDAPWIVVDYDIWETRLRVTLLRKYATKRRINFSYSPPSAQYIGSMIEDYLRTEYRWGCSKEILDVMSPTRIVVINGWGGERAGVVDRIVDDVPIHTTEVGLFIPSAEELNLDIGNGEIDGVDTSLMVWEYFSDVASNCCLYCPQLNCSEQSLTTKTALNRRAIRKSPDGGPDSYASPWLRSASYAYHGMVVHLLPDGTFGQMGPYFPREVLVACTVM